MTKLNDLTNQKFGKLIVIKRAENDKRGNAQWLCKCECGKEVIVRGYQLIGNITKSCGCLKFTHNKSHGLSNTKLYKVYTDMKYRCNNKKHLGYSYYGERGIDICKEWGNDFNKFYEWAIKNGYKEGLTIDRIDVNGNYEPDNCRWVNQKIQQRNKRNNINITYKNETHCLMEWSEILSIKYDTLRNRICRLHWNVERTFTTN